MPGPIVVTIAVYSGRLEFMRDSSRWVKVSFYTGDELQSCWLSPKEWEVIVAGLRLPDESVSALAPT